jgi:hypothetical protein
VWERLRGKYANVASTLALVVAMAGGAYAASLPRNSVGTNQIKPNAVRSGDVKADALRGADVDEGSLGEVSSAADAGSLDGLDSTAFLGATAKAADAETVDGIDSNQLVQGGGRMRTFALNPAADSFVGLFEPPPLDIDLACDADPDGAVSEILLWEDDPTANRFVDTGGAAPQYFPGTAGLSSVEVGPGADAITIQRQAPNRVDTIWLSFVGRPSECHVQGLWIGGPTS